MVWEMHEGMGWWMVLSGALTILFWAGIIGIVAWGIVGLVGGEGLQGQVPTKKNDPLDIAIERYAKGEISKEQFDQIKKDLT
jgi:putative membrane protein